ncbi:MAG TPA: hypothetical protein VGQ64_00175 [Candidatus Limnocylindrales bacterium]|nr:hypothetical protein [Candidatus Limnocylindrales bacterium]
MEATVRDVLRHNIRKDSGGTAMGRQDVTISLVPEPDGPAGDEGEPEEDAEA